MKVKTKYSLIIFGIFILELFPVPFSSIYSLYAIRKRPGWLPKAVDKLYDEEPAQDPASYQLLGFDEDDVKRVQKKATIVLLLMFAVDLLVPVVIPTAFYVVRLRPRWFRNWMARLYADKFDVVVPIGEQPINPQYLLELEKKLADLNSQNLHAAKSMVFKGDKRLT